MGARERRGRVDRFEDIYDATYARIVAYMLRRVDSRDDAFDAVSDTFVVVWRRLDDVPEGRGAVPWVYGVARRVLANHYRSRDRRFRLQDLLRSEARAPSEEDHDLVHDALDRLRPADRELLTLAAWDGLSNAEIGEVLDVSAQAVAVKLHRARGRLATELGRVGFTSSPEISNQVKSDDAGRTPNRVNGTRQGPGEVEPP